MKTNPQLIFDVDNDDSQLKKVKSKKKKQMKREKGRKVEDGEIETRTVIKILPMKNLEILVIGGSKVGKTTLINKLL